MTIEFHNVTKSFSERTILEQISFIVPKGRIVFILGRSGMGKSVTLKLIMGLLKPDTGTIIVNGIDVTTASEDQMNATRKKCGMVFQHPALFDSMTIFENIAFGMRKDSEEKIRERVQECLNLVHLSENILTKRPSQISYGMQKRVSLARTIAPSPDYMLFDEPTTGLDPITTTAINELIQELSSKLQVTSIVVSHDMGCALKIADKIMIIDQAAILANGTVAEIKGNQTPLITSFLAEAIA